MSIFEAVILFSPDLSSAAISKEEDSFTENIDNSKGNITNKEDLKSLTYRYNKRVELALQQFPRSLLKKILYKKKLNQVFKRWESILN